ncbi:beta-ketoacyl synthase N-terminal-like domain-containing protein [Fulvimarina sp. MAC8]|uniref:type I polyketide synthase n=1 Tax=Fulvimarina sp. MAC8 TaxID=3162874 RepID=UPI0032EFD96C
MNGEPTYTGSGQTAHQIAVIGMAARLPGADNVARFWENLVQGRESIRRWTREELKQSGLSDAEIDQADFVPVGAPIDDAARFDAAFFGYSPAEAELLDPQQRVFLETAWAALETAGYSGDRHDGPIGVYAAAGVNTYLLNIHGNARMRTTVSPYEVFVANDKDFTASRTAYKLNLRGPAVAVQSACSSSLVAVHMAVQSLLGGECDIALAGGVSLAHATGYQAREGSILSADGHCRAFDAAAAGTVPGSGVGAVVLKRLDDAIADGDTIDAVILGSAVNNDGSLKASFTAPQVDGQAAAIAEAHAAAGIDPGSIGYVEAHGTGTPLGDPIEIAALTQAFRRDTDRQGYCAIGSVKTNIGHLDTAAGIAGFIKAVLCVRNGKVVPSLHFEQPNPKIDLASSPFFVGTKLDDWPLEGPRRACVSSFGIGGTNAHAVLEQAPATLPASETTSAQLLTISANTPTALERLAVSLADRLEGPNAPSLRDTAFTLRQGRCDLPFRQCVASSDRLDAVGKLRNLKNPPEKCGSRGSEAVLLFPGQGSQRPGMGKGLYDASPSFRQAIDHCATHLDGSMQIDFRSLLFGTDEAVHETRFAQPALFAVEYALARSWLASGLKPVALHGHSIGEYVAATLAGVVSLEDALKLVVTRGRLMQASAPGAMLAIIHPDDAIASFLGGDLALAAVNAPGLSVASGPVAQIEELRTRLDGRGIGHQLIRTSHAFHSPMMHDAAEAFREALAEVSLHAPTIPLISNVTGTWMSDEQARSGDYWADHLLAPVLFEAGTRTLLADGDPIFIEAGPGSTLAGLTRQTAGSNARVIGGFAPGHEEYVEFLEAVGRYWCCGGKVEAPSPDRARRVPLPTYPFEGEKYWIEPDSENQPQAKIAAAGAGFYATRWERAPSIVPSAPRLSGNVVIFDDGAIGEKFADEFERGGAEPYRVIAGKGFEETGYRCFSVDPQSRDDFRSLVEELESRGASIDRIVFAWPLSRQTTDDDSDLARSLVHVACSMQDIGKRVSLVALTLEAEDVTGAESSAPSQAMIAGALRVIAQENANLSCRRIDLGRDQLGSPGALAKRVRSQLGLKNELTALRGQYCWLPTVERLELSAQDHEPRIKPGGVHVVVGDIASGVGEHWLAGLRASSVRLAVIEDCHPAVGQNADLELSADCTNAQELGEALRTVATEWGRIDGVFLSLTQSNEESAALITDLDERYWAYNRATKLAPLRALDEALGRMKVGFCCVQSSLATMAGGLGLAAYAGTYRALEQFVARKNRSAGVPWFSIGYPLIGDSEPAVESTRNAFAVTPDAAWDMTRRIIDVGYIGQIAIAGADILAEQTRAAYGVKEAGRPEGTRQRPEMSVPYLAPQNPAEAAIVEIFEDLLGLQGIGVNDGFYELGGHSLLAIRALAKLREAFPVEIEMRELLFDNPTASGIAAAVEARSGTSDGQDELAGLLDEVGSLSDEDVTRMLAEADDR